MAVRWQSVRWQARACTAHSDLFLNQKQISHLVIVWKDIISGRNNPWASSIPWAARRSTCSLVSGKDVNSVDSVSYRVHEPDNVASKWRSLRACPESTSVPPKLVGLLHELCTMVSFLTPLHQQAQNGTWIHHVQKSTCLYCFYLQQCSACLVLKGQMDESISALFLCEAGEVIFVFSLLHLSG